MILRIKIATVLLVLGFQVSFAQKKDENIGTEVVNVVKPYTPSISDAFKVKETPSLEDEDNTKKEEIKYQIFSFPVASTFVPAKGTASDVDKTVQERLYKNYATLGFGNYGTAIAELFVTENLNDKEYVGGMFRHQSSQGGIKQAMLSDKYYDTSLDLTYGNKQQNYAWKTDFGYQNQAYNWYGLPETVLQPQIDLVDPKNGFQNLYLGGKINFNEGIFNEVGVKYSHFWDSYGSAENRFYVKPTFSLDVLDSKIKTNVSIDYLGGTFEKDFTNAISPLKYGYLNLGINPNYVMNKTDLTLNLGVNLFYSVDNQNSTSKFFIYPKATASYKVVGNLMIAYAGAEGELKQNSYRDFTNSNPFVSPTLNVAPTDAQYDIYVGLKGKLANTVAYNIRGSYLNEKNKALFVHNGFDMFTTNTANYHYGNSFDVVYDNMKTISFFGELKADFSKTVAFGINGTFNSFTTDAQTEAWNLPAIKLGTSLDVAITSKWFAGAHLFFVGDRKDVNYIQSLIAIFPPQYYPETTTIKSYFDANLNLGYKYSERFTAFLKFNNLANQGYQKWVNYPVQGFQVLLGASYKFDF
jgi:hypothetical protein